MRSEQVNAVGDAMRTRQVNNKIVSGTEVHAIEKSNAEGWPKLLP